MPKYTYRLEFVRCCKAGCTSCPHGPYWYAYYREGNRLKKKYIGKTYREIGPEPVPVLACRLDDIFHKERASADLAWEILGLIRGTSHRDTRARMRELVLEHHTDRGGDAQQCKRVTAAYSYLSKVYGW